MFGANQGLVLNETLSAAYTLDFMFNFANVSGYRKLVDYAAGAADKGVYVYDNLLGFYTTFNHSGAGPIFVSTVDSEVTVTRDDAGMMNAYVNQQLVLSYDDSGNALVFGSVARFFMDDGVQGNEASAGQVDFLRIYDSALTDAQVRALAAPLAPGNNNVPEPGSTALVLAGIGILGLARRRRQRGH